MGAFLPANRQNANAQEEKENGQRIHNAEQEVNNIQQPRAPQPPVHPVYMQNPPPAYMHAYPHPYHHPYPAQGASGGWCSGLFYQLFKWILTPISIMYILSNPQIMGMLGNIIGSTLPDLSKMKSFWHSSFQYEPIRVNISDFEDCIDDISNFVNIDHTPMSKLVVSMSEASRSVKSIESTARRALSHTNIPETHKKEIQHFFKQLSTEIKATRGTAKDANMFYHQHRAQLDKIRFFLENMKDSVQISNIPDFLDQIDEIIEIIVEQKLDLVRIKRDIEAHHTNMESFRDRSEDLQNDVLEQKDVTKKTESAWWKGKVGAGAAAALTAAAVVNPVAGVAVGLLSAYIAHEDMERIESELKEFGKAADMFSTTTDVLDGVVKAIDIVIDNLDEISVSLKETRKGIDMTMYKLGELERKQIISKSDQKRLTNVIDFVIDKTRQSKRKYEKKRL